MRRMKNGCLAVLGFALVGFGAGCGEPFPSCEGIPEPAVLDVTLTPGSVLAGTEVTVVASFERAVFENGEFYVHGESVVVEDAATEQRIGEYSTSRFREDLGDPPIVSGVVSSAEVIDDRSMELTLEFPDALPNGAVIRMRASYPDGDCSGTSVSGEALLTVTSAE